MLHFHPASCHSARNQHLRSHLPSVPSQGLTAALRGGLSAGRTAASILRLYRVLAANRCPLPDSDSNNSSPVFFQRVEFFIFPCPATCKSHQPNYHFLSCNCSLISPAGSRWLRGQCGNARAGQSSGFSAGSRGRG